MPQHRIKDIVIIGGLVLNLATVIATSGRVYGRVDAVLNRAVEDIRVIQSELKEETDARVSADVEIRKEIVEVDRRIRAGAARTAKNIAP